MKPQSKCRKKNTTRTIQHNKHTRNWDGLYSIATVCETFRLIRLQTFYLHRVYCPAELSHMKFGYMYLSELRQLDYEPNTSIKILNLLKELYSKQLLMQVVYYIKKKRKKIVTYVFVNTCCVKILVFKGTVNL